MHFSTGSTCFHELDLNHKCASQNKLAWRETEYWPLEPEGVLGDNGGLEAVGVRGENLTHHCFILKYKQEK